MELFDTKIEIPTDLTYSKKRLTFVEYASGAGDKVMVCIHSEHDEAPLGTGAYVYKSALIRAAKMLETPFQREDE